MFRDSDDSSNRRKFLRDATIATGLVVGIPGAASAKTSDSNITDFDPSSNEEIREFALEVRKLPENERQEVFESLSEKQLQASKKAFAPSQIEVAVVEADSEEEEGQFTTQSNRSVRKAKLKGTSTLGFHLWTWIHRVAWSHNGRRVWNVNTNDYAHVNDPTWGYKGTKSKSLNVNRHNFNSYRQGKLTFVGGNLSLQADPYARIVGRDNGSSSIISKGDGY